jgi:hypothetical protein
MSEALAFDISPNVGLRFWTFTPFQFGQIVAGWQAREDAEWYRVAWMTAHMLAPWSKKTLKPETLLGPQFLARRRARRRLPVAPKDEAEE